jgi:hypothetical protein
MKARATLIDFNLRSIDLTYLYNTLLPSLIKASKILKTVWNGNVDTKSLKNHSSAKWWLLILRAFICKKVRENEKSWKFRGKKDMCIDLLGVLVKKVIESI